MSDEAVTSASKTLRDTRWARLEALFFTAAALPETEQGAFLDAECADAELRRDVGVPPRH